ncbi:MAG TPA: hypothetical protein PLQ67_09760, partial [Burkholderiaceae bacterium]|nr:hypothetical protein [Burkholderiaceae bacterium]
AEWSNAPDSKSGVRFFRTVGSNPTLSAMVFRRINQAIKKPMNPFSGDSYPRPHQTRIDLSFCLLKNGLPCVNNCFTLPSP